MKRLLKRTIALLLCAVLLPIENIYVFAETKGTKKNEPPAYMRELSKLVAATASEDDFGEIIKLRLDAPLLQRGQSMWVRPVYRYTPEKEPTITWSSSDTTVATVTNQGRVTSVGVGTAEITAKINDACFAAKTITVQKEPVEPTEIDFLQAPEELTPGDEMQMLVEFIPINAAMRPLMWTSSDPSVLSVSETGVVTAKRPGSVTITVQIEGSDVTASCAVTVLPRDTVQKTGDADGDGTVTLRDVVLLRRYLAGGWNVTLRQSPS